MEVQGTLVVPSGHAVMGDLDIVQHLHQIGDFGGGHGVEDDQIGDDGDGFFGEVHLVQWKGIARWRSLRASRESLAI